ncbi:MAG: ABC transporter ATP-binding protein [Ignavibacteria bacterium]|jgi:ATP-binding cassette subfamily B protein|nr:ABC transporter ATP-binding protein [Ignavibacteria bacterium]MCU7498821.1 ABC transporter ATP-binding protein [Ignavibacteria bacterium]MCU7520537.1 ABC transporter ATP-binding protein [Ignavibacteria bacterium]MCU7524013.1 ABC transporter ATP-binding protein [Ignavibacteria bacterium]
MFLFLILGLTLVVAAANALEPLIMKYIFDRLGGNTTTKTIIVGAGLLLGLGLFRDIIGGFSNWLSWRTRLNIQYGLLEATVAKLHRLPAEIHRIEGVGAIMTRLDRGITGFMSAITEISFNVLPALTYLVMAVIVMIQLDWRLTILVCLFAPVPAIIAAYAAPKQTQREQSLLDRWVRIYSRFNEVLSGIITVRSFAMEDAEKQRFLGNVKDANDIVVRGIGYDSGVSIAQSVTITVARIAAIGLGGFLVLKGQATLGTLVAFISYVGGLFGPVQGLTGIYRTIRTASVSLDQIFSILDTENFLDDKPDAVELKKCQGEIAFEDVRFNYGKSGNEILKGVDIKVKPGEMVAIVGPSGSGKTTLMALLMRFYDPTQGRITMDGVDLKDLKQNWLRKQIGVVLQDALLFNESIKNNIAYGRPNATQAEIEAAAKAANAHDFIMKLENGYDTVAGERGSRLSGGERQRIAIARALLKDAPVLILDEATSALDAELEAHVQEALDRLVKGRTTFVIAHRLSTVVNADRILVLRNGRIVEEGCHRDLLSATGYYASLVEKQMKGLAVN